ncbi:hypothetical protein TIFTF001_016622 [Ficus carica]|uniref:Uncharacterized protein n=1 Tax=Ficus carica TaxID=3494 RepID=A0AA88A7W1_FICCA|nr:hypothetical protein TIFTF001_016622 [Ficus carica]
MYTIYFKCGLRLPIPPLLIQSMHHYQLAIPQLMSNGMRVFLGLIVLAEEAGIELLVDDILAIYYPQENSKDHGRYSMYPRRKKQMVGKELKKPPPKALLFEEKLERLLAQPNREWDEINVPKRLKVSSLWKDFINIPAGFNRRVSIGHDERGIPQPQRPSCKEEGAKRSCEGSRSLIRTRKQTSSLVGHRIFSETSGYVCVVPCQEMKIDGKPKRKIPTKRKKASKVASPEMNAELGTSEQDDQSIGVNLPPGMSLLQNRKLSVEIMCQLLSDVDLETINAGRIPNHLDDLVWDVLKSNLRALGLIYHTTDMVLEQRNHIKDLEEKDKEREEKLLNIKQNFESIKASTDD